MYTNESAIRRGREGGAERERERVLLLALPTCFTNLTRLASVSISSVKIALGSHFSTRKSRPTKERG